jgi:hypothetical protein
MDSSKDGTPNFSLEAVIKTSEIRSKELFSVITGLTDYAAYLADTVDTAGTNIGGCLIVFLEAVRRCTSESRPLPSAEEAVRQFREYLFKMLDDADKMDFPTFLKECGSPRLTEEQNMIVYEFGRESSSDLRVYLEMTEGGWDRRFAHGVSEK